MGFLCPATSQTLDTLRPLPLFHLTLIDALRTPQPLLDKTASIARIFRQKARTGGWTGKLPSDILNHSSL